MKVFGYVLFVLFVLAIQVFFLDRMWSGIFISIYLAIVLLVDIKWPVWVMLLLGFVVGGIVDIASTGCGLNAAVTVCLAFVRLPLIRLTLPTLVVENAGPIVTTDVPLKNFFLYLSLAFAIWSIPFFILESGFTSPLAVLIRIVVNTLIGPIVVFLLQLFIRH